MPISIKSWMVYIFLFLVLLSCDNSSNDKDSSSNDTNQDSTERGDFNILLIKNNFTEYTNNIVIFRLSLDIENRTLFKITNLKIIGFLELEFENEPMVFIPTPLFDETEDEYIKGILPSDPDMRTDWAINLNNPWLPNQKKTFNFTIPEQNNGLVADLQKTSFERTPQQAFLIISYNAISVDGEFNKTEKYDLIDQWKEFQTKLGLR